MKTPKEKAEELIINKTKYAIYKHIPGSETSKESYILKINEGELFMLANEKGVFVCWSLVSADGMCLVKIVFI
jgi:hypothetical protein